MEKELMQVFINKNIEEMEIRRRFFVKTSAIYMVAKEVCRRKCIHESMQEIVAKVAFCDNIPILNGLASQLAEDLERNGEADLGKTLKVASYICNMISHKDRDILVSDEYWEEWIESL